jgi:hypothetical protein
MEVRIGCDQTVVKPRRSKQAFGRIARSRSSRVLAGAIVVAAAAALGYATLGRGAGAQTGAWAWPNGVVPGEPVTVDSFVSRMVDDSPGIVSSSLREVASVGEQENRNQLLAGKDASGTVCVAERGGTFLCLDGRYNPYAVVVFPIVGGSSLDVVDRASLVGIARSDVARVTLLLASGKAVELGLDQWRAFSYEAHGADSVPTQLRAFDPGGHQLQRVGLSSSPPGSNYAG